MGALHGVVSTLGDADQDLVPSQLLVDDAVAMGARAFKVPIRANSATNALPLDLYKRGMAPYAHAGLPVRALLDFSFNRPWLEGKPGRVMYPNEVLGYQGNKRWNRFIKDSCVRAQEMARALVPEGIDTFIVGNEGNLLALLDQGMNIPPVAGSKSGAVSPEAYLSYGYEMAHWLKEAGAKHVYLGALSWIAGSGNDAANPYGAAYLARGLSWLRSTGARDIPWAGITTNSEGWFTAAGAAGMAAEIAHVVAAHGLMCGIKNLALPLLIGEWGERNGNGVNPVAATEDFQALDAVAAETYLFQYLVRDVGDPTDFGCRMITVKDGQIYPAFEPLSWYGVAHQLFTTGRAV